MTLSFHLFFLAIFLIPTLGIMWSGLTDKPHKLFLKGLGLLLYIGMVSYWMIDDADIIDNKMLKISGNVILLVVSILTSVMISVAWTEIRQQKLNKDIAEK